MIHLVTESFLLVLIPLSFGVAWKTTAALSRLPAAPFGIEPGPARPLPMPRTQPHRYADHASARSWLSTRG